MVEFSQLFFDGDGILIDVTLPIHRVPHASLIADDLFGFVSTLPHKSDAWVGFNLVLCNFLKQWMHLKVFNLPIIQLLDISDDINLPSGTERIGIITEQCGVYDASTMILLLEVRVSETEEHLF